MLRPMLCSTLLCLSAACWAAVSPAPKEFLSAADVAQKADQYLQARATSGSFIGMVLLAKDGETLFSGGYGFANEELRIPNTAAIRFPIASITKTFTATMVLQMQRRGLLSINDPLCRYVKPCPTTWGDVTLRHLLMHTSGIPNYASGPGFIDKMRVGRSREEIVDSFRDQPLDFAPGARYSYSNSGYFLLGVVLEEVGRKPYADLLSELILQPLGMRDTGYDADLLEPQVRAAGYVPDGADNAIAHEVHSSWLFAAGGIYSTVDDLLAWDRALYSDTLLPRAELEAMWDPAHGAYGYGWQILAPSPQSLNRPLVFHAGGTVGYSTDLLRYPTERVTIIILANMHPVALAGISRDLSAIVLGEAYAVPEVRRAVKVDPAIYADYVGEYALNPSVTLTVTEERGKLAIQATGQQKDIAVPESPTTFFSRISPARVSFVRNAEGYVDTLLIHDPSRDIPAMRIQGPAREGE